MTEAQKIALEAFIKRFNVCRDTLQTRVYNKSVYVRYKTKEYGVIYEGFDEDGFKPSDLLSVSRKWEKAIKDA